MQHRHFWTGQHSKLQLRVLAAKKVVDVGSLELCHRCASSASQRRKIIDRKRRTWGGCAAANRSVRETM